MMRLLALLALCLPGVVQAIEILHWQRMPLALPLRVAQERVVFLERPVRVGVPVQLEGKLRVQSAGGVLYLLASDAIAPTRLQLQDTETGALILLDIAATAGGKNQPPLEPVRIIADTRLSARYGGNDNPAPDE